MPPAVLTDDPLDRAMPPASDRQPRGHVTTLPPSPDSATTARHLVRRLLPVGTADEQRATAELLTTELVTNAVVHACTPCRLRVSYPRAGILRVEVSDAVAATPALQSAEPTAPNGRGLQLVAALAADWGTAPASAGKTVWFETAL